MSVVLTTYCAIYGDGVVTSTFLQINSWCSSVVRAKRQCLTLDEIRSGALSDLDTDTTIKHLLMPTEELPQLHRYLS